MRKGIVYKGEGIFSYCGWPTVGKLSDGTLAVVFSGHRLRHVCTFGETMICYSYDEGKTWTAPSAVVNTRFDDRDGGIAVNGKQVLVTSFNNNFNFQSKHAEANEKDENVRAMIQNYIALNQEKANEDDVGSSITVSEDGGKTFFKRYMMPITSPHGPKLLKDGRYVYVGRAFSIQNMYKTEGRTYNELPEGIYYMFSGDGYTWTEPLPIPLPQDEDIILNCEPDVIECADGELLVHIRVQKRNVPFDYMWIYQTKSKNGITEWETPYDLGVQGAPPHLFRHSSGKIVCVYGCRKAPFAEMAIISEDEGKTWSAPRAIDADAASSDLGYPSSVELQNGKILTVYYQRDEGEERPNLKYTIWEI